MNSISPIIHPKIRPDSREFIRAEKKKISDQVREEYRKSGTVGGWWTRVFLEWKIAREVDRRFRGRLYFETAHTRSGKHGFTLIELLVVLAIVAVLVAIAVPALQGTSGASKFSASLERIKGVLDVARSYAQAQNTYVWVAFYPADPGDGSGDELFVVTLASNDGTNPFSTWNGTYAIPYTAPGATSASVQPVEKIAVFRQLRLNTNNYFTSAQIPSLPATSTDTAPAAQPVFTLAAPGTALTLGQQPLPAGAEAPVCSVIAFTPAGTAVAGPNLSAVIGLDFQPMKATNVADGHNLAELQISGTTGTVQTFRN